jgi:hypothetical protein
MANFTFTDLDDGDETWVGVRSTEQGVGLTLSKKANGDIEVFMTRDVAVQIATALRDRRKLNPRLRVLRGGVPKGVLRTQGQASARSVCVDSTQTWFGRCGLHFVLSQHEVPPAQSRHPRTATVLSR